MVNYPGRTLKEVSESILKLQIRRNQREIDLNNATRDALTAIARLNKLRAKAKIVWDKGGDITKAGQLVINGISHMKATRRQVELRKKALHSTNYCIKGEQTSRYWIKQGSS